LLSSTEQLHAAFVADPGTLKIMVEVAYKQDPNQQRIAIRMASLLALDRMYYFIWNIYFSFLVRAIN
jgi:hypothetical protein